MLMMSRRAGESILIGDDIEIVIARIGRSRVKVGIRAPRETPVMAGEIALVRDENVAASAATPAGALTGLLASLRSSQVSPPRADERKRPARGRNEKLKGFQDVFFDSNQR